MKEATKIKIHENSIPVWFWDEIQRLDELFDKIHDDAPGPVEGRDFVTFAIGVPEWDDDRSDYFTNRIASEMISALNEHADGTDLAEIQWRKRPQFTIDADGSKYVVRARVWMK